MLIPFCKPHVEGLAGVKRKIPGLGHVDEYSWDSRGKLVFVLAMTAVGLCGSLLDSVMGAVVQASVVDVRTGRVIEGDGGKKVKIHSRKSWQIDGGVSRTTGTQAVSGQAERRKGGADQVGGGEHEKHESRKLEVGWDLLDNNGVNFAMAGIMSAAAMAGACVLWDVPFSAVVDSIFR